MSTNGVRQQLLFARYLAVVLLTCTLATPLAAQSPISRGDPTPSVSLPAELDRVLRDYERAWRAKDVAALVSLFTTDGFVMQPGRPPARGTVALTDVYRDQGGGPLQLRALAYGAADTVAYIIGGYRYADETSDTGKFTLTLRRAVGGRWLIASDMDSGNR